MNPEDEIKELHKRISALQNSTKEVLSETKCRFCPVVFIKWFRRIFRWEENK